LAKERRVVSGAEADLEAGSVAELGVIVGAGVHIAHRVGEGARAAAHRRSSGVGWRSALLEGDVLCLRRTRDPSGGESLRGQAMKVQGE
jgi:hypothetical protein